MEVIPYADSHVPRLPSRPVVATGSRGLSDSFVLVRAFLRLEVAHVASRTAHHVNAAGKFLIPGLWDMHVHVLSPARMRDAGVE